ncbi:hypothetical protein [Oceanicoccus sagamiensis]|uniref:KTSC domain-containing protein n=1 Tax=Oceanicoccus sagamiensis TaxID=716816 RepID=A0A1X9ND00_9GAMM|nr:hypothetical protein [Oceanicoccus sagamiensis]ARN73785.1 hypothetical protein BST96_06460 [Oceanicoccus sagamiensis]
MARPYKNRHNDSGVTDYAIGLNQLTVWFAGSEKAYTYTADSVGQHHVDCMKRLAQAGEGLNAYINRYVKKRYQRYYRAGE